MATIIARKRKDGTTAYRAQILIKRDGKIVLREGETFNKKRDAELWVKKREGQLSDPDKLKKEISNSKGKTIKGLIEDYEEKVKPIKPWGRSKQAVLESWKTRDEGGHLVESVDTTWLIEYCMKRKAEEGAGASTIGHDLSHLRSVFAVAKDVLGVPVGVLPFIEAQPTLKKLGLVARGNERDRRPEFKEISDIVELAYKTRRGPHARGRNATPMDKLIIFQMFSSRRISETCRLLWSDVDRKNQKVLVRDMKDPGRKDGNDVTVFIPNEAWAILLSMPEVEGEDRIFPYNSKSVSTYFQRIRDKAGYYDKEDDDNNLTLHDLRHECLSWLAEKNGLEGESWDVPRLQMVSGHKGWGSLQRYVNLIESEPNNKWKDWEWKTKVLE